MDEPWQHQLRVYISEDNAQHIRSRVFIAAAIVSQCYTIILLAPRLDL